MCLPARRYSCFFACLSDGSAHDEQKENRPSAPTAVQSGRRRVAPPEACGLQIKEAGGPVLRYGSEKVCKHPACSRFNAINNSRKSFRRPACAMAFWLHIQNQKNKPCQGEKNMFWFKCWLVTFLCIAFLFKLPFFAISSLKALWSLQMLKNQQSMKVFCYVYHVITGIYLRFRWVDETKQLVQNQNSSSWAFGVRSERSSESDEYIVAFDIGLQAAWLPVDNAMPLNHTQHEYKCENISHATCTNEAGWDHSSCYYCWIKP